jgi:hypothetical protein
LLRKAGAPIEHGTNATWGGTVYALDPAHAGVRSWLEELGRRAVQEWGYDYLKIDFLLYATEGDAHAGGATHAEAYRAGLAAIRNGLGPDAFLLGCGAPLQHAVGAVNGMRIGTDVDASWNGIQAPARATGLRSFYHRGVWFNDPDCLVVRPPLSLDEARVWTAIVALSGGMALLSDDLPRLPTDRLALLQRALPVAPVRGRAVDAGVAAREIAPAISASEADPVPLRGVWRFHTGDDLTWAQPGFDDSAWETIMVPEIWERAGHPGYDGFAWYRTRFTLPVPSVERARGTTFPALLDLGRLDDSDETYINGVNVGHTGTFPPEYRGDWQSFRGYMIPEGVLNWAGRMPWRFESTMGAATAASGAHGATPHRPGGSLKEHLAGGRWPSSIGATRQPPVRYRSPRWGYLSPGARSTTCGAMRRDPTWPAPSRRDSSRTAHWSWPCERRSLDHR